MNHIVKPSVLPCAFFSLSPNILNTMKSFIVVRTKFRGWTFLWAPQIKLFCSRRFLVASTAIEAKPMSTKSLQMAIGAGIYFGTKGHRFCFFQALIKNCDAIT